MTNSFTTHAFIAGELDRSFYGRNDLDKYALGVALARNFYIDFRGGLKSRPGTIFRSHFLPNSRSFEFFVSENQPPLIICLVPGKIYFFSDTEFLTRTTLSVASSSGNSITLFNASSISVNDFIYAQNFPYLLKVIAKVSNTLTVAMLDGQTPAIPAGTEIYPLFTIANFYTQDQINDITAHYRLDRLVFTTPTAYPQVLVFGNLAVFPLWFLATGTWNSLNRWEDKVPWETNISGETFTLSNEIQLPVLSQPTNLSLTTYKRNNATGDSTIQAATGSAFAVWTVTAVDENGKESIPSRPFRATSMFNYTVEGGNATLKWDSIPGAFSYRVYRSIITENSNITIAAETGFIGNTSSNSFVDNNFIPDFVRTPPSFFSPFNTESILNFQITAAGSGYNPNTATITVFDGVDFIGYPIVDVPLGSSTGSVTGILIYANGTGYSTSSNVIINGGTGAEAQITSVSPSSGLNPAVSTVFQQRRIYAGLAALPLTVFGSQPGDEQNFNAGIPPIDSDSYTITLDTAEVVPVRHMLPMRAGLILMTSKGIYRLFGRDDGAVTPNQFVLETQAELGVGRPKPVVISNDLLFTSNRGSSFHALTYTFYTNSYSPQEISILAPHLFGPGRAPKRIVWLEEPDKLLWVLREDGTLLSLTYMKEQEIFAWAQHQTSGFIRDICPHSRPDRDSMMLFVEREGNTYIEELAPRNSTVIAEYWGSDLSVGFSFAEPVNEITNLWHLEGIEVQILADGDVLAPQVVTNGTISFTTPASVFRIGRSFECLGISLPLSDPQTVIGGRLRRIIGSAVRLFETRGLEIGTSLSTMYNMKDKGWEDWDEVTALRNDNSVVLHRSSWQRDAQIYFRQRYPLPATVLGYVTEAEIER